MPHTHRATRRRKSWRKHNLWCTLWDTYSYIYICIHRYLLHLYWQSGYINGEDKALGSRRIQLNVHQKLQEKVLSAHICICICICVSAVTLYLCIFGVQMGNEKHDDEDGNACICGSAVTSSLNVNVNVNVSGVLKGGYNDLRMAMIT